MPDNHNNSDIYISKTIGALLTEDTGSVVFNPIQDSMKAIGEPGDRAGAEICARIHARDMTVAFEAVLFFDFTGKRIFVTLAGELDTPLRPHKFNKADEANG